MLGRLLTIPIKLCNVFVFFSVRSFKFRAFLDGSFNKKGSRFQRLGDGQSILCNSKGRHDVCIWHLVQLDTDHEGRARILSALRSIRTLSACITSYSLPWSSQGGASRLTIRRYYHSNLTTRQTRELILSDSFEPSTLLSSSPLSSRLMKFATLPKGT